MEHEDSIRTMIDMIMQDQGADAMELVHGMLADRVSTSLDDRKLTIATTLGNNNAELSYATPAA